MIRAALLATALLASAAHADAPAKPVVAAAPQPPKQGSEPKPDPTAVEAGEGANLESMGQRTGMVTTLSLVGGGVSLGINMRGATGQGQAAILRVAHAATPRTMVGLELVYNSQLQLGGGSFFSVHSFNALVGAQYYLNPAVWVRGAAGAGVLVAEDIVEDDLVTREGFARLGPTLSGGAGADIFRGKRFRLGAEYCATAWYYDGGVLLSNALLLNIGFD